MLCEGSERGRGGRREAAEQAKARAGHRLAIVAGVVQGARGRFGSTGGRRFRPLFCRLSLRQRGAQGRQAPRCHLAYRLVKLKCPGMESGIYLHGSEEPRRSLSQRKPWAELGICLHNLTEKQSQHPELFTENLLGAELQVGCLPMHHLNGAHSDLFLIDKAHLSERLKDFQQPAPKMKTACTDSGHMRLPPFLVPPHMTAGETHRYPHSPPPARLCDPMGVTSPY